MEKKMFDVCKFPANSTQSGKKAEEKVKFDMEKRKFPSKQFCVALAKQDHLMFIYSSHSLL
jgi:hypothetical protein